MFIARILFPIKVLGPGNRIAIWMSGCEHQCKGCSNPELWKSSVDQRITLSDFTKVIDTICHNYHVDGFTLTGGDPFFQPDGLREMLPYLYSKSQDILVYTGYKYEDLIDKYEELFLYIGVLIDGKYIEAENHGSVLRGSDNQRIIFIKDYLKETYAEFMLGKRSKIQNFTTADGVISVGIHLPGYENQLREIAERKGLEEYKNG